MHNRLLSAFTATYQDVVCAAATAGAKWEGAGYLQGWAYRVGNPSSHSVMLSICQYGLEEASIESFNTPPGVWGHRNAVHAQAGAIC